MSFTSLLNHFRSCKTPQRDDLKCTDTKQLLSRVIAQALISMHGLQRSAALFTTKRPFAFSLHQRHARTARSHVREYPLLPNASSHPLSPSSSEQSKHSQPPLANHVPAASDYVTPEGVVRDNALVDALSALPNERLREAFLVFHVLSQHGYFFRNHDDLDVKIAALVSCRQFVSLPPHPHRARHAVRTASVSAEPLRDRVSLVRGDRAADAARAV